MHHMGKSGRQPKKIEGGTHQTREAGLKVNVQKSKLYTKHTKYLGCVLTTDGIKPQQNRFRQSSH